MADLNIRIGRYLRSPILVSGALADLSRAAPAEILHASEDVTAILGALSRLVSAETVHASESASLSLSPLLRAVTETLHASEAVTAVIPLAALSRAVTAEALHVVANTVTRAWQDSGVVTFLASAGHATVTGYTAQLWAYPVPGGSPVDTEALGVPTPDGNFLIQADLTTFFGAQDPGDYTLVIVATDAGGSTPSPDSSPFTLPLP